MLLTQEIKIKGVKTLSIYVEFYYKLFEDNYGAL